MPRIDRVSEPSILKRSSFDRHQIDSPNKHLRLPRENAEPVLLLTLPQCNRLLQMPTVKVDRKEIDWRYRRPLLMELMVAPVILQQLASIGDFKKSEDIHNG